MGEMRSPWAAAQRRALVRGVLAAGVSTGIALIFHLAAGGEMPALPGLVVPLFLATSVCILLTGMRLPWLRLLLSVGVAQVLFHNLFMIGAADPGAAGGHAHHAMSTPAPETYSSWWMFLAHVAATVLTALALRHGELVAARIGTTLRRLTWRFLHPVMALPARATSPSAPLVDERAWVPTARLLVQASLTRRGPPAPLTVPTP